MNQELVDQLKGELVDAIRAQNEARAVQAAADLLEAGLSQKEVNAVIFEEIKSPPIVKPPKTTGG